MIRFADYGLDELVAILIGNENAVNLTMNINLLVSVQYATS